MFKSERATPFPQPSPPAALEQWAADLMDNEEPQSHLRAAIPEVVRFSTAEHPAGPYG